VSWRVFWILTLIFGTSLVATMSIMHPATLAKNSFLVGFVNHELLSVLVVVMTITFASVANIELSLNRMQRRIADKAKRAEIEQNVAGPLRREIRSSAWLLFWALVVAVVAVLVKGAWPDNQFVLSLTHGIAVLLLVINGVVLYDIYATSFALVEGDNG
jgi:hypothetical protein